MIRPLGQRILLEKIQEEKTTASGIVLPGTSEEKNKLGLVVELGTGRKTKDGIRLDFDLQKGQKVLYEDFRAKEFKFDDKIYLIIDEEDVLAVIE